MNDILISCVSAPFIKKNFLREEAVKQYRVCVNNLRLISRLINYNIEKLRL